jgi:tetratricopeptide (TPR) repeat protein
MSWSLDLMANLSLAQGDDRKAEEYYLQAHELLLKVGLNDASQAWHFFHQGDLETCRGHWREARKFFQKSLTHFEKAGSRLGITEASIHLGEASCRLESYPEVEKVYRRAARMALESKMIPQLVELAVGVARLLKAQGDDRQAMGFLLAALAHPTCRRHIQNMNVPFVKELESHFTPEQWEGALLWAKTADIEGMIAAWVASDRSPRRHRKSTAHPQKARKSKAKKHK